MPEGLIVKALSGYYYVLPDHAKPSDMPIQCRGRGILRKNEVTPLVGDRVIYTMTDGGEGTVDEILPRTTELIRPQVANADTALLVFAAAEPDLSTHLLDKFLVHTEKAGLQTTICISKSDLLDPIQSPKLLELMRLSLFVRYMKQLGIQYSFVVREAVKARKRFCSILHISLSTMSMRSWLSLSIIS